MTLGEEFEGVLAAARAGSSWAVAALYRDLQPSLLGYLRAQEPGHAEDLASDVWLGVGQGIGRFEGGEGAFRGWVFTIARRRVLDLRRQRGRRKTDLAPTEQFEAIPAAESPEATVLAALGGEDARELLVSVLPPDQADVVLLRVIGGLDTDQVANVLGKRPGSVRVLQHRALRRLANVFAAKGVTR